ncbi:uncharacterized protein [Diadema antillarum]|uniref:uncharacterized protein n=1 Tax=Diadema antillarum TaxID=105358 RepID=UPI003A83B73E
MEYQEQIRPWNVFLKDLAAQVRDEEFDVIKRIIGDKLSAREREAIEEPGELLEVLEDKNLIGEDNTGLLKEIFEKCDYLELIPELNQYEEKRREYVKRVSMLAGRRDPLFVGRDEYIQDIIDFMRGESRISRNHKLCCVCLWGMAGSGKTKLAAEICAIYAEIEKPSPTLILVDLNQKKSINDVGMALLSAVGSPVDVQEFELELVLGWIRECITEYVLLLDNADDLLKPTSPTKDHFQNLLKQSVEIPNANVKIILTSRYAVNFPYLSNTSNFKEMEVKPLEMAEAVRLLTKSVQQGAAGELTVVGREIITEKQAIDLATHCGNNPQALRAVASQLRFGKSPETILRILANPIKMELVLNDLSLFGLGQDATKDSAEGSKQVLQCLGVMFQDLAPQLKPILVQLAILPGLFSQSWGLTILADPAGNMESELEFYLDDVVRTSLLVRESLEIFHQERERRDLGKFYSMHPLVRCLCLMMVQKDPDMKKAFQKGLLSYINKCFKLLQDFTSYDNEDASGSLQRMENEKVNITQYLELEMRKTFDGKPHPLLEYLPDYNDMLGYSDIARNSNILAFMERFMFTEQRSTFFEQRAEVAHKKGDIPGWVNYSGWFADQQLQLHKFEEAENAIKEPVLVCEKSHPSMSTQLKEGYSQCLYVKSNLLVHKPQNRKHIQRQQGKEGIRLMEKCIEMRREVCGNKSIVTARTINALGSIYFRANEFEKALNHHKDALAIMNQLTNNHPEIHPDAPFYVMNIGTCYHEIGYLYSLSATQKDQGTKFFQNAISAYNQGRDMLRGVGMERSHIMGSMLKNLAMTYCEMKDFKQALTIADIAAGIREETLGHNHPDVARAHYFVGSLYMSLGDEEKEKGRPIAEIREYKKARECFDHALEIEFTVGYERRSQDYDDLKEDIEKLFTKILMKKREWERYKMRMVKHEKGEFVPLKELGQEERKRPGDPPSVASLAEPESPPKKCLLS